MAVTREPVRPHAGLCDSCAWQRVVVSGRGSAFSLCRRAAADPRFPKYPALPVRACAGHEAEAAMAADDDPPGA